MRARVLAMLWVGIGVAVWCGFFDLYVSRGAREYGQRHAEYELHMTRDEPSMIAIMTRAQHEGVVKASVWAGAIVACGWATIRVKGGSRSRNASRGSL